MANVYNTLILNSYASTISGQIDKIEDARDVIKSKAIELGLKIPARLKLTSNALGTTDLTLTESHSLLDTAAAIDTIVVNTPPSETASSLGAGGSYTVPVGYNKVAYTITASGLSDQTGGDANPLDILWGKTAWVNGAQVTGAMLDRTGDQNASGFNSYKHTDGNSYLSLTIPETGKYEGGKALKSNIAYRSAANVTLPVTIITNEKGETILDSSEATFEAGYYSGNINVLAVLKDSENKVLNVSNNVPTLESQSGNLIIPDGFDYFAPNASYTIKEGSIADVKLIGDSETGQVRMNGGEVTAGWISSNVDTSEVYTPPTAKFGTSDVSGKIKVTTAGWISKDTEIGGIQQASSLSVSSVQRNGNTATLTVPANSYYVSATVTQGYVATTTTKDLDLGVSNFSLTLESALNLEATTINSSTFYIVSTKGYTEGQTKKYQIKNGVVGTPSIDNNYILKVPVQEGWVNAGVITYEGQDQKYIMKEADTQVPENKFTVGALANTLMKSLEIDTSVITNRLSLI